MTVILSTCPPPTPERPKRSPPPHVAPKLRAREWHEEERGEKWRGEGPQRLCSWGGFNETQEETLGRCILQDITVVVCACMHVCKVVAVSLETSDCRIFLQSHPTDGYLL